MYIGYFNYIKNELLKRERKGGLKIRDLNEKIEGDVTDKFVSRFSPFSSSSGRTPYFRNQNW